MKTTRDLIEKEIVDISFFALEEALKERKIKRLDTYADLMYMMSGNCLNPTIIDNCRILKQNVDCLSLKSKELKQRVEELYQKSLTIKKEIYLLVPKDRGLRANKEYAKLFKSKQRTKIDSLAKKYLKK